MGMRARSGNADSSIDRDDGTSIERKHWFRHAFEDASNGNAALAINSRKLFSGNVVLDKL